MAFTDEQRKKAAETRRRKTEERRGRQEAAGIPDSRPFAQPRESLPIEHCHIEGKLVADMSLPPAALMALDYWATDEGIAERNAQPNRVDSSGITFGADGFTKGCQERRDMVVERGAQPWEAPNPLKDVADQHVAPGFKGKFLSPERVQKDGLRGYDVVRDANGDPVRVRGMVLGQMPVEKVEQRNKHYRDKGQTAVKQVKERFLAEGKGTGTAVAD